MDKFVLAAEARDSNKKAKQLVKESKIPAIYYGKGVENISLQLDYSEFLKTYRKTGMNTVIDLKLGSKTYSVLVQELTFHPVSDRILHVDFINVKMDEEISTEIPLEFTGTSLAVKDFAGILMTSLDALEVKCLPKDLVSSIEVDISVLEDFNAQIFVRDLKLPNGIKSLVKEDVLVASVVPPRLATEEEETSEADGAEETEAEAKAEGETKE